MLILIVTYVIMLNVFAAQYDCKDRHYAKLYCILCHILSAFLLSVIFQRFFVHTVTVLDSRSLDLGFDSRHWYLDRPNGKNISRHKKIFI
jgi:hypothetical protein